MDDHFFDEGIRKKLSDYEAPGFDPTAMAALHHQMGAEITYPWYHLYRTELITCAAIATATCIILFNQWFTAFDPNTFEKSNQTHNEQIASLQKEIDFLKQASAQASAVKANANPVTADQVVFYNTLLNRLDVLQTQIKNLERQITDLHSHQAFIGFQPDSSNQQVNVFKPTIGESANVRVRGSYRIRPHQKQQETTRIFNKSIANERTQQRLSVKTMRDVEEHYQKGIGIRLGPTMEISKEFSQQGNGRLDLTGGVLADLILSPALSFEPGVKFVHRFYEITDQKYLINKQLPGINEMQGSLKNADIDSWILEIPLNFKYRHPLSLKNHWLAGLGYSSLIYTNQVLEYEYEYTGLGTPFTTNSEYRKNSVVVYPGTFNVSFGLSKVLKNKKILETSIYYQHGLSDIGAEKIRQDFLGVRGVYWFTVR
ncbi:MAG: outer membrane beta-barrel protein [Flammeovirgaceae bacterium]|nr:outer membrane beta-barrel protein [Flammeovirgaceae bacterium]